MKAARDTTKAISHGFACGFQIDGVSGGAAAATLKTVSGSYYRSCSMPTIFANKADADRRISGSGSKGAGDSGDPS